MDLYELREQTISLFLGGPVPPLYTGFPGVRASVHASMRVRKLVEAEMTMTVNIKVCLSLQVVFLGGPVPPLYTGFPVWVRAYVRP